MKKHQRYALVILVFAIIALGAFDKGPASSQAAPSMAFGVRRGRSGGLSPVLLEQNEAPDARRDEGGRCSGQGSRGTRLRRASLPLTWSRRPAERRITTASIRTTPTARFRWSPATWRGTSPPSPAACASSSIRCPASGRRARITSDSISPSPLRIRRPFRAPIITRSRSSSTASGCTRTCRRRVPNSAAMFRKSAACLVGTPHYLGPLIVAQKDRPVRVKFTNRLPTGAGGNLFIPVDTTLMGAGDRPQRRHRDVHPEPGHHPSPRRQHPLDQRRDAPPVDHPRRREHLLPQGRERLQRPRYAGPRPGRA